MTRVFAVVALAGLIAWVAAVLLDDTDEIMVSRLRGIGRGVYSGSQAIGGPPVNAANVDLCLVGLQSSDRTARRWASLALIGLAKEEFFERTARPHATEFFALLVTSMQEPSSLVSIAAGNAVREILYQTELFSGRLEEIFAVCRAMIRAKDPDIRRRGSLVLRTLVGRAGAQLRCDVARALLDAHQASSAPTGKDDPKYAPTPDEMASYAIRSALAMTRVPEPALAAEITRILLADLDLWNWIPVYRIDLRFAGLIRNLAELDDELRAAVVDQLIQRSTDPEAPYQSCAVLALADISSELTETESLRALDALTKAQQLGVERGIDRAVANLRARLDEF